MIELAKTLRVRDSYATLTWVQREENVLADALTNLEFDAFDERLREPVDEQNMGWLVMDELMQQSETLFEEIKKHKELKRVEKTKVAKKQQKFFAKWTS